MKTGKTKVCPKCGKLLYHYYDKIHPYYGYGHFYPLDFKMDYSKICTYNEKSNKQGK